MALEIRPVTREELDAFIKAHRRVFGDLITEDSIRLEASLIDLEQMRTLAVFDGARIVGTTANHSFEITVPGGLLPLAGVADVTVQPTHRRKGVLTQMMSRQLRDSYEKGEPLAALWPSETLIYGRFGYGMASFQEEWTIERHHTAFAYAPELHGRVVFVEPDEASKLFPDVYQRACSERPGMVRRNATWWGYRLMDLEQFRQGGSAYYHAIYERDGRPDGYVLYRMDSNNNALRIVELVAATDEAYAALWQFCFGIDLMQTTRAQGQPTDAPLLWMLADPRRLRRSLSDAMWLRLVDVRAALSGRRYAQEGSIVFDIKDSFCPWNEGRVSLVGGPDAAECAPTKADADLALSVADLAAVYLGAVRFSTLLQTGRVREQTPGAILRADSMFATRLQPWCVQQF